jgi:hypothetical protein
MHTLGRLIWLDASLYLFCGPWVMLKDSPVYQAQAGGCVASGQSCKHAAAWHLCSHTTSKHVTAGQQGG